jgi:LmbE family N-acetylglucosaminyl deacetylase
LEAEAWPQPYLQPNPREDCGYYTAAYIARCLGHPGVTAGEVKAWRAETRKHETAYARDVLGAEFRTHWTEYRDSPDRKIFWQGPAAREWTRGWLEDGWIAAVCLRRIAEMDHAAAVLGCSDEGVLLMDPVYGHITEPWGWFLGPGPKAGRADWPGTAPDGRVFHGCHFIEGWYRT